MLVDAHCHLDYQEFDADRDDVMGRASDMVVVNSIVEPESVEKALGLCRRYENLYCTLGLGASDLDEGKFRETVKLLRKHRGEVVGLGEVGLDYHWVKDDVGRETEEKHFTEFIRLSGELKLPLVVHSREAERECINILGKHKTRAIMHCFSGTVEEALDVVERGCLISVPANVAHVKSRQRMVEALPLESVVLETDSPYLSPVRGERNEPVNVRAGAEKIAELKDVSFDDVAETTTSNALGFFGIKHG